MPRSLVREPLSNEWSPSTDMLEQTVVDAKEAIAVEQLANLH
jgi:hypothetical protein